MSGLNSIEGLNKVGVDYRPELGQAGDVKGKSGANDIQKGENAINAGPQVDQPEKSDAKSVLRQLDVLLMNAAKKSVMADAEISIRSTRRSLLSKGIISKAMSDELESLATTATAKLKALDKFTGADIALAVAEDAKNGSRLGWSTGENAEKTPIAKAVEEAITAQQDLSAKLYDLNNGLCASGKVDGAVMDQIMEIQFQCDRRATEITSVLLRMHDLAQKDAVEGKATDPRIKELLKASFMDLMPREAILMHGTADAIKMMQKRFADQMRPFADKLDAFIDKSGTVLTKDDIASLQASMATMKNAVKDVRENGIEVNGGRVYVDRSILQEMENLLDEVDVKIQVANSVCAKNMCNAFLNEVKGNLLPGNNLKPPTPPETTFDDYVYCVSELVSNLECYEGGSYTEEELDGNIAELAKDVAKLRLKDEDFSQNGYDANIAKKLRIASSSFKLIAAQFKELIANTREFKKRGEVLVTAGDVRRMLLGEVSVSSVVEATARGFKAGDANSEVDAANIVDSRPLGSGAAGRTYQVKMKNGERFVFKPELEGRVGLGNLSLGRLGAYKDTQTTANLNLATQDTAKVLGCEDIVVKYYVGSHDGQFGFFMEKAPGFSGSRFGLKKGKSSISIGPENLKTEVVDKKERDRIKGQVARQLNRLQWLDIITGQGDRHWNNYFLHIDKTTHKVTLKAIDNDASFTIDRIGVQKYRLSKERSRAFMRALGSACLTIHHKDGYEAEFERCSKSPAITDNGDGTITVDMSLQGDVHEIGIALRSLIGPQSLALPEAIDKDMYDRLMALDNDKAMEDYLATLAPRLSAEALESAKMRLIDAIKHAKTLAENDKVFSENDWQTPAKIAVFADFRESVEVTNKSGDRITLNRDTHDMVGKYLIVSTESYYKRDYMDAIFG